MGEQPIFSTKAHVFHIDPKTKTSWIPASNQAVTVSFFYDSTRSLYRIISVEGTKAVINSTITPSMLFTKTSQKFGQWSDVRANTVYGLGFDSEGALVKFIEQFKEVKKATRLVTQKAQANGSICQSSASTVQQSASSLNHDECRENNSTLDDQSPHQRSHSLTSLQTPVQSPRSTPKTKKSPTLSLSSTTSLSSNSIEAQLRYENDKLKVALAQSSANAKKWEIELQTLKSNNSRLTTALQESTANVEEWKKQLEAYKEECTLFKKNMLEFKAVQGESSDDLSSPQKKMLAQEENKYKDQKIQQLSQRIADLTVIENDSQEIYKRFQDAQSENKTLVQKIASLQEELNNTLWENQANKNCIQELQTLLGVKLKEAGAIHDQILSKMQS